MNHQDHVPRNPVAAIFVIGLHLAVFCALLKGLDVRVARLIPTAFQTSLLPHPRPPAVPPSLPRPTRVDNRLEVPMPEVNAPEDPDDRPDALQAARIADAGGAAPTAPAHAVLRLAGGPGAGFPDAEDYYPTAAKRLEEQGITIVRVCVDPAGRLTAAPALVQSSGHARLDEGALQLARAGSGHYRPATEDGRPISSCDAFRVRFRLRS